MFWSFFIQRVSMTFLSSLKSRVQKMLCIVWVYHSISIPNEFKATFCTPYSNEDKGHWFPFDKESSRKIDGILPFLPENHYQGKKRPQLYHWISTHLDLLTPYVLLVFYVVSPKNCDHDAYIYVSKLLWDLNSSKEHVVSMWNCIGSSPKGVQD